MSASGNDEEQGACSQREEQRTSSAPSPTLGSLKASRAPAVYRRDSRLVRDLLRKREGDDTSIYTFVTDVARENFENNLPLKSLRRSGALFIYSFGVIYYTSMLTAFALLFSVNYYSYSYSEYLSTKETINSIFGDYSCVPVSKDITGTFIAGFDGVWRSPEDIDNTNGFYKITFDHFKVNSNAEFANFITSIDSNYIAEVGASMESQTTMTNLLYLMNYKASIYVGGYKQTLQFTAEPTSVFNMNSYVTSLSDHNKTSGYTGSYIGSYGKYEWSWKLADYKSQYSDRDYNSEVGFRGGQLNVYNYSTCQAIAPQYGDVKLKLDMETYTVAMSINLGILNTSHVSIVDQKRYDAFFVDNDFDYSYKGNTYQTVYVVDKRYPTMEPAKCLRKIISNSSETLINDFDMFCFVFETYSYTYANYGVPTMSEFGYYRSADGSYAQCSCALASLDTSNDCQLFSFVGSIIFFPVELEDDLDSTLLFDLITGHTYEDLNRLAYNASRSAFYKYFMERGEYETYIDGESYSFDYATGFSPDDGDFFAFCDNMCAARSIILDHNYLRYRNKIVNAQLQSMYNVTTMCHNFVQSPLWSKLASSPPAAVVESYFECSPSTFESMSFAFASAQGVLQAITIPIVLLFITPLVYLVLSLRRELPSAESFTPSEKRSVLSMIAEVVLEERDNVDNGLDERDPLRAFSRALVSHARRIASVAVRRRDKKSFLLSKTNIVDAAHAHAPTKSGAGSKHQGGMRQSAVAPEPRLVALSLASSRRTIRRSSALPGDSAF